MIFTPFLFTFLVAHALFIILVQVKKNFPPNLSNVFFYATHIYKRDIIVFILKFNDTLFPPMLHSLKVPHFSLPLCHPMRFAIQMFEISLMPSPYSLNLHFRSTSDGHPVHRKLEMILIHQHHLLLQLFFQQRHLNLTFQQHCKKLFDLITHILNMLMF